MAPRMASRDSSIITLVPHSGVQFVTFGLDIDVKGGPRFSRKFFERPQFAEKQPNGRVPLHLLPGYNEADPDAESDYKFQKGDDSYDINRTAALDPFIDEWVPVLLELWVPEVDVPWPVVPVLELLDALELLDELELLDALELESVELDALDAVSLPVEAPPDVPPDGTARPQAVRHTPSSNALHIADSFSYAGTIAFRPQDASGAS